MRPRSKGSSFARDVNGLDDRAPLSATVGWVERSGTHHDARPINWMRRVQNASHACTGRLLPCLPIISNGETGARLAAAAPVVSIAAFGWVGASLQPATIVIVAAMPHITAPRVIFRIVNLLIVPLFGRAGEARSIPYLVSGPLTGPHCGPW